MEINHLRADEGPDSYSSFWLKLTFNLEEEVRFLKDMVDQDLPSHIFSSPTPNVIQHLSPILLSCVSLTQRFDRSFVCSDSIHMKSLL